MSERLGGSMARTPLWINDIEGGPDRPQIERSVEGERKMVQADLGPARYWRH